MKGKYSARAGNARLAEAQQMIERLKQDLAQQQAANDEEVMRLRNEICQLRAGLTHQAEDFAAKSIIATRKAAKEEVARIKAESDQRMRQLAQIFYGDNVLFRPDVFAKVVEIMGIRPWDDEGMNRIQRRATPKKIMAFANRRDAARRRTQGLKYGLGSAPLIDPEA